MLIGTITLRLFRDRAFHLFRFYLLLSFFTEFISVILGNYHVSNHFLLNINCPIELCLLLCSVTAWIESKTAKNIAYASAVGFVMLWLILFISGCCSIERFDSISSIIESILITSFSGYYLLTISTHKAQSPVKIPEFWLAAGMFIYFCSTLLFNAVSELYFHIEAHSWFLSYYLFLYSTFNIIAYSFYSIALLCKSPNQDSNYW